MKCLLLCWALIGIFGLAESANILAMLPLPAFSHTNGYLPIFAELAKRGHNVTVVSPFPRDKPIPNYKDVVIPNTYDQVMGKFTFDLHDFNNIIPNLLGFWMMCPAFLDVVLEIPELQTFINDDRSHFDIVITETFFCQEPFSALALKYSAHLIALHPLAIGVIENSYIGGTVPFSYVPILKLAASDRMSFSERFLSSLYYTSEIIMTELFYKSQQEKYMRDYFKFPGSENLPHVTEILKNHSLLLLDSHISVTFPKPLTPNVIEVGGLSNKAAKPLTKDLEEYISGAKDGVIFLTWGSHYKSTNMKNHTLAKFLSAFSKLKQRVLMKWEKSELPGKPDNVRIQSWFPQASVLSHPKVKAFITHCGIHGISEAMYHGVPVLGTPLFGDQYQNLKHAEKAGMGIHLDIDDFTEEELVQKLKKLVDEPEYKEAAKRQSAIFKDRPLSGLDNAAYWIEYVLRHNGAKHLRPASIDIPFYQYFLLDIIGLSLAVLLVIVFITVYLFKALCCRSKSKDKAKKSKKE